jgi:ketosteroid isomerase-like protein
MSQRAGTAEAEIKTLIEAWADAVRRHDLPAILAHHDDDIVMFDVPPPLQSRGMAAYKKTWDLFFAYTNLGRPSTSKSYKCASETPSPLRSPSCVAGRLQSVALPCRVASSFD